MVACKFPHHLLRPARLDDDPAALAAAAATTASLLNSIARREVATVDLLLRPPFRFVHDVVMEVVAATGFGAGLWVGIELDAVALRSAEGRDGKLRFVKKLIGLVWAGKALPHPPFVRASKILAGLEPGNTNVLLQVGPRVCCVRLRVRAPCARAL
jgi:hypothetical protein